MISPVRLTYYPDIYSAPSEKSKKQDVFQQADIDRLITDRLQLRLMSQTTPPISFQIGNLNPKMLEISCVDALTAALLGDPPYGQNELSKLFDQKYPLEESPRFEEDQLKKQLIKQYNLDPDLIDTLINKTWRYSKEEVAKTLVKDILQLTASTLPQDQRFIDHHFDKIIEMLRNLDTVIVNPLLNTLNILKSPEIVQVSPHKHFSNMQNLAIQKTILDFFIAKSKKMESLYQLQVAEHFSNLSYRDLSKYIKEKYVFDTPCGKYRITDQFGLPGHLGSIIKTYVIEPVGGHKTAFVVFRGTKTTQPLNLKGNIMSFTGPLGPGGFEVAVQLLGKQKALQLEQQAQSSHKSAVSSEISNQILEWHQKPEKYQDSILTRRLLRLKEKGYSVITAGHSLGGATAALSYILAPGLVDRVIARNASGFSPVFSKVIRDLFKAKIGVTHKKVDFYNNFGDMLSGFYDQFGTIYHVSCGDFLIRNLKRYNQEIVNKFKHISQTNTTKVMHSAELLTSSKEVFIYKAVEARFPRERQNLLASLSSYMIQPILFGLLKPANPKKTEHLSPVSPEIQGVVGSK